MSADGLPWDIAANLHLLAYIRRVLGKDPRKWGNPRSAEQRRATEALVAHKNRWAQQMRDLGRSVPVDVQKRTWAEEMRKAERQIRELCNDIPF